MEHAPFFRAKVRGNTHTSEYSHVMRSHANWVLSYEELIRINSPKFSPLGNPFPLPAFYNAALHTPGRGVGGPEWTLSTVISSLVARESLSLAGFCL